MKTSKCLNCKNEFNYYPSRQNGKYCNNKCQQEHQFQTVIIPLIEEGKVASRESLKRYLIKKSGERCSICGVGKEWNNIPLPLQVDHIDGNSDNDLPNNIRLLCPNCHSQQPTTKNRNIKEHRRNVYLRKYKQTLKSGRKGGI